MRLADAVFVAPTETAHGGVSQAVVADAHGCSSPLMSRTYVQVFACGHIHPSERDILFRSLFCGLSSSHHPGCLWLTFYSLYFIGINFLLKLFLHLQRSTTTTAAAIAHYYENKTLTPCSTMDFHRNFLNGTTLSISTIRMSTK